LNEHLWVTSLVAAGVKNQVAATVKVYPDRHLRKNRMFLMLGLVNKLSSIFGWLRLRLAVSAKLGLPTSSPAFRFLASLVLAGAKNET